MNKKELMKNHTMDELEDMSMTLSEKQKDYKNIKYCIEHEGEHLHSDEYLKIMSLNKKIDCLKDEAEKYREAFEKAKEERDKQICEYRNRIEELENRTVASFLPAEPIEVAGILIGNLFDLSDLRQIAEHLLVYCNAHTGGINDFR